MANPNDRRSNHRDVGFNTIHHSAVGKRRKTATRQKYTLFAVIALLALMIAVLLVMAIGGIIANVSGDNPGQDKPPVTPSGKDKIVWASAPMDTAHTQEGPLVLVGASHPYKEPSTNSHLAQINDMRMTHNPRIYASAGLSAYMEKNALKALDTLLVDFHAATGKDNVVLRYAYISSADLQKNNPAFVAGTSDYNTGYGCELAYMQDGKTYQFSADSTYAWISENCHKYGIIIRYPAEKSEITGVKDEDAYYRYVGVAHATYMKGQNICLEEYITLLKDYTPEKPLKIAGADGNTYEVYYVAVNGSTSVKVPTNYAYTVSGTNEGGVVITVNRSQPASPSESESDTGTSAGTTAP